MRTLVFTRPSRRLEESVRKAESMGFRVLAAPSLDIVHGDAEDYERVEKDLLSKRFTTAIFSSATAAEECSVQWGDGFPGLFEGVEIIAIGPGTSKSLTSYGLKVTSLPARFDSQGLVDHIGKGEDSILIVHSDHGSDILTDGLVANGHSVEELISYRLQKHVGDLDDIRGALVRGEVDFIAFTSRLSVDSFMDSIGLLKDDIFVGVKTAAIGDPTAERMRELGIRVDIIPPKSTFDSLLNSMIE